MLHLEDELEANLYEIIATYLEEVQKILDKFDDIVSKRSHNIENCLTVEYVIRLTIDIPVVGKMRYHILKKYKWIEDQIKIMLENGVIEESNSPYAFNIIIVKKKDEARESMDRFCVNYGLLNKITIPDRYLLFNINEICSRF